MKFGVSYFGNRILEYVETDMRLLKTIGFDFVVHTYSENDFEFYEKTMHEIVKITKDEGLEAWLDPWGLGGFFGGEAYSSWVLKYSNICQIDSIFERVPAACPNNDMFRKLISTWIKSAAESGADFIFWDEPHFYQHFSKSGLWCCRCASCVKKFNELYNSKFPLKKSTRIKFFKMESIIDFLSFATDTAEKENIRNAICILPEAEESFLTKVASLPNLEILATDPYGILFGKPLKDYVKNETRKLQRAAKKYGKKTQIWTQAFKVPHENHKEVIKAMDIPLKLGADSIAVWGYKACKYISSISSEFPDELWGMIEEWVMKNEENK
ncbi:MAG: hypothetical protein E3J41_06015 [Candidatus Cloacimonadota bacterium]|nr:MAG: hypothetical protein E3J41_06015 [Candidatus Cloacimonadota bacterium]